MTLYSYDFQINLELASMIFKVEIHLYHVDEEDHYLHSMIINHNRATSKIRLVRIEDNYFATVYTIDQLKLLAVS